MARYWEATTFTGFYVEGRNLERSLASALAQALGGRESEPIMGAGIYIWLQDDEDPSLRVKDLGDRALIEMIVVDRTVFPKKEPGSVEADEAAGALPPSGGDLEDLKMKVDGILGGLHSRVSSTPPELRTKLDLKLEKWERPKPMAIATGGATSFGGDIAVSKGRGGGGGVGGIIAMVAAIVVLAGAGYYLMTTAGNDPYYLFQPGRQYQKIENAVGFTNTATDRLVVITSPTRIDTLWGRSPRFVRAEEDTVTTGDFAATSYEELRVNKERMFSVVLEPAPPAPPSTASELDFGTLQWNRAEVWETWFETEINRAIVRGLLVRDDGGLWLQSGQNLIRLTPSDLLTPAERVKLAWAQENDRTVQVEIRFIETLPLNRVRSRSSNKLFSAEIRQVKIDY